MSKLAENTFTEGMVLDLHPSTVPNNVLTDALNATLITMNGNEFVLQNDMGNGRIEKAYLPPGYVPVGIKEYGGVVYIASYNPLTNKGLIGSFPSPERNIDLEELGTTTTSITWDNFKDDTVKDNEISKCKTFIAKTELFGGKILRSGDKFTIYFDKQDLEDNFNNLLKYISNYNNISGELKSNYILNEIKAISPKKNILSIYLTVLDSNNNLRDITKQLKRFKEGDNTPLEFDSSILPIVKENTGFFILKLDKLPESTSDLAFLMERLKRVVNTYNNKLFGKIYLTVQLNIIDYIDVSVTGQKVTETNGTEKANLIFDTTYVYNCPDGFTDSENTDKETIPGYSGYLGNYKYSVIEGVTLENKNSIYECPFPIAQKTELEVTPIYDINQDLYHIKLLIALDNLEVKDTPIFNYIITPNMIYSPLEGLAVKGSIDLTKLSDNTHNLNTWKYYCDNNVIRITWGMASYPSIGKEISDVQFEIYDVLNTTNRPIETINIESRSSYNGTFTLNIYYNEKVHKNTLYLVLVSYYDGSKDDNNLPLRKYAGARWLLTNGIFNRAYLTGESSVLDFNDLVQSGVTTEDGIYKGDTYEGYTRYDFIDEFKDLIRINLNVNLKANIISRKITYPKSIGSIYNVGTADNLPYLSKKNATQLDSSVKMSAEVSIKKIFPFDLNEKAISYTFSNNPYNTNIYYDSLNIIGDPTVLPANNLNIDDNVFSPILNDLYDIYIIEDLDRADGNNQLIQYLDNNLNKNILKTTFKVHSLIISSVKNDKLKLQNYYTLFLNQDSFESVFKFPYTNWQYEFTFLLLLAGGEDNSGRDDHMIKVLYRYFGVQQDDMLFQEHSARNKNRSFIEEFLDKISDRINSYLESPIIAMMGSRKSIWIYLGRYNSKLMRSGDDRHDWNTTFGYVNYGMIFWRGIDGKYHLVDNFFLNKDNREDTLNVYDPLMLSLECIYIYKNKYGEQSIYKMDPDDVGLVYMKDFDITLYLEINVKSKKVDKENLFTINNHSYLDILITNTKQILNDKHVHIDDFNRFISGVWFVSDTDTTRTLKHSDSFTVKGTELDYYNLLNLDNVQTGVLLGADGEIFTHDKDTLELKPSSIYYYERQGYPLDVLNMNNDFKLLSLLFTVVNGQLLFSGNTVTKNLPILIFDRHDTSTKINFDKTPVIDLGEILSSPNFYKLSKNVF